MIFQLPFRQRFRRDVLHAIGTRLDGQAEIAGLESRREKDDLSSNLLEAFRIVDFQLFLMPLITNFQIFGQRLCVSQFIVVFLVPQIVCVVLVGNQAVVILCRTVHLVDQGEYENAKK